MKNIRSGNKKLAIGLMSGTSADGIDAVLVEIRGHGISTTIRQIAFATYPYPAGYKKFVLKNSDVTTARLDDIVRLNILTGNLFADAAKKIARKGGVPISAIGFIGSHGQTIHHLPDPKNLFGHKIRATLQIGDPSVIAKRTGVVTVGDFRVSDIAVGGSGAPLVPYMDYLIFRAKSKNRILLNIGGIANMTILPKDCTVENVIAFDIGPGNMLIDGLMKKLYKREYDKGGKIAYKGEIITGLISDLLRMPYFRIKPPKSTGRELFGESLIEKIISGYRGVHREDLIATVSEFTALSIYQAYRKFVSKKTAIDELLVSGGGVHNKYIMEALMNYFRNVSVKPVEEEGFSSDAKEAICFAILANETLAGNPANIPGATGAARQTVLGKICPP